MAFITVLILLSSASYILAAPTTPTTSTIQVCCSNKNLTYSEEWNFFNVRKDANLFYWLYSQQSKANEKLDNRPWFLWLQGGPGLSATGVGNLQEIGPLDFDLKPRDSTWLSRGDLLFVDSPVGSGYSYVTNDSAYTQTADEVANDLTDFIIHFLSTHAQFRDRPFYLMGECYASKMATVYAWHLHEAIRTGKLQLNFRGVGLGQSFVAPIIHAQSYPEYLYYLSRLSVTGLKQAKDQAALCQNLFDKQQWTDAHKCFLAMEELIGQLGNNVSLYNVMKQAGQDPWSGPSYGGVTNQWDEQLDALMNGPIRQKLNIPKNVVWGSQRATVYDKHSGDFVKPVIDTVDNLLNTNLTIFTFSGQFDLLTNNAGVNQWMSKLKWASLQKFQASPRQEIRNKFGDHERIAYLQTYNNLHYYVLLNAGHLAPADAPIATLTMLDMILSL
jgi:serine carboxypeptidase 1